MNAYLIHLAQTSEIQPIRSLCEIGNSGGEALIDKDRDLDASTLAALAAHTLCPPIHKAIVLEAQLDAEQLYGLLLDFVHADPGCATIYQQRALDAKIRQCVLAFSGEPMLLQRLNVLAIQLPDVFDQALFCAWLAVTVLACDNYPQARLNEAFTAALCHDFGLLEIHPDILFKTGPLSVADWQVLQTHPQLGARLLAEYTVVGKQVVRAVAEHHEHIDGSGYPQQLIGGKLSGLGRLLNLLDSVNAIYRKHFKPRQRSLRDMVPIIQMNTLSRGGQHAANLVALFLQVAQTTHTTVPENYVPQLIQLVKDDARFIESFIGISREFSSSVGFEHGDLRILALQNTARHIRKAMTSCGIINDAYLRWLDQVEAEHLFFAYRELEDVLLMCQEILFHIERFNRQLDSYLASSNQSPLDPQVQALHADISAIAKPAISAELAQFLAGKAMVDETSPA